MGRSRKEGDEIMRILVLMIIVIISSGCATGSLRLSPDEIRSLQTEAEDGTTTNGCVSTNVNATSGIIGGTGRLVITWGTLEQSIIDWCTGR